MNGNFFCAPLDSEGVSLSATDGGSDINCFRGLQGAILRMGVGSHGSLGGCSIKVTSVECPRGMCALVLTAGVVSGEAAFLMLPLEIEVSSRQGFSSSSVISADIFHRDDATTASARSPEEIEGTKPVCEDEISVEDTFPPSRRPSGGSLSAGSYMLPNMRLSGANSDSRWGAREVNNPHLFRVELGDLSGSIFGDG